MAAIHAACFAGPDRWDVAALGEILAMTGCFGLIDPRGGFVLARTVADEAEILTLAVIPAARRHGIARALMAGVRHHIGQATLFLEVSEANAAALALYGALGFTECGRRRRYYPDGADALVLRAL